jgi:AraC-like DNA-binding protein
MCQKIKNDINTSHVPVILLTAKTSDDFTIEGFDAGADDYIPKPFNPKLLHSRIKNILEIRYQLRERFRKEGILQPSEVSVTSADEVFLKNAMGVVERNIGNPEFRVCTFVSEMNMSRSVLYRKFESLTGQSVNEFVRNTRLKRAAQLLSLNELTVSEVTYEVGFNDPQYFSKCFSKQYGMTPSDYARKHVKKVVES